MRVAVIEDIGVTLAGLTAELSRADMSVVGVSEAAAVPARLQAEQVDVVVCDLYLQGEAGPPAFGLIDDLVDAGHRIVVHSTWALDPDVLAVIDAGALAYVQKSSRCDPLIDAVRRVARMSPTDAPILTPEVAAAVRRRQRFGLTPAELEVLTYLGQHLTNAEIAELRSVSLDTVKTQLNAIRGKLGATNRAAAVRTAHEHGLLGRWVRHRP